MNPWVLGIAAATAGWFLLSKESRQIFAGRSYRATFVLPATAADFPSSESLQAVLPPGAGVLLKTSGGERLVLVTFVAPRTSVMTDITTPFGALKLLSLQELK